MVYIVNEGGHDYSAASSFGELKILTKGNLPVFSLDRIRERIKRGLKQFDPEKDFILLSGSLVPNVITVSLLVKKFGQIKILIFDAKKGNYKQRELRIEW